MSKSWNSSSCLLWLASLTPSWFWVNEHKNSDFWWLRNLSKWSSLILHENSYWEKFNLTKLISNWKFKLSTSAFLLGFPSMKTIFISASIILPIIREQRKFSTNSITQEPDYLSRLYLSRNCRSGHKMSTNSESLLTADHDSIEETSGIDSINI